MLVIFLMALVSISAVAVLTFSAKLRAVKKDRITLERMETVREALQQYYLSNHDLPAPAETSPPNTIPAKALNLSQEFRFNAAGRFIHYNRFPDTGPVDILGIEFRENPVAAVLVAPGPDGKLVLPGPGESYGADSASDNVFVAVSLNAEAVKIATRAVGILQAAAKAYDWQIYKSANDGKTDYRYFQNPQEPTEYISETESNRSKDGYVPAVGGSGDGCVRYGRLDNDPDRGVASLDGCPTAAENIGSVYGLSERYMTDPWGESYRWGNSDDYDETDRRYWSFFSMGPDKAPGTEYDITPTTDRIERVLERETFVQETLRSTNLVEEPI